MNNEIEQYVQRQLAIQQQAHQMELARVQHELLLSNEVARKLKVKQETSRFKRPEDKRAVEFLVNEQFDLKEITDDFMRVIGEAAHDEDLDFELLLADNPREIAQFLKRNLSFLNKRDRCVRYELEAYNMSIKTPGGWLTEKKFREDSIFLQGSEKANWWEEPELSVEKKYEKLRKAEADVKREVALKKVFYKKPLKFPYNSQGSQRRFTRWDQGPQSSATWSNSGNVVSRSPSFIPLPKDNQKQAGQQGPNCYHCGETGHIQKNCPKK